MNSALISPHVVSNPIPSFSVQSKFLIRPIIFSRVSFKAEIHPLRPRPNILFTTKAENIFSSEHGVSEGQCGRNLPNLWEINPLLLRKINPLLLRLSPHLLQIALMVMVVTGSTQKIGDLFLVCAVMLKIHSSVRSLFTLFSDIRKMIEKLKNTSKEDFINVDSVSNSEIMTGVNLVKQLLHQILEKLGDQHQYQSHVVHPPQPAVASEILQPILQELRRQNLELVRIAQEQSDFLSLITEGVAPEMDQKKKDQEHN